MRAYHELLQGQGYPNESLVVDVFVINRVRTREREDLSFPKKHALAEVRWHQFLAESVHRAPQHGQRIEVLPNLRHAGIFHISTIQEPLTRPAVKLDEKMSICSSTPSTSTLA